MRCKQDLEDVVADLPIVAVQDKEEFKRLIRGQVNQLLYMIYGLLALAIVIAVIGIINTLGLSVHRADPRDRPAPGGRPARAAAASDDHAGVGGHRAPRARCSAWCSVW